MVQWVKDPALSLQRLRSLLWFEFNPPPRNFHQPRGSDPTPPPKKQLAELMLQQGPGMRPPTSCVKGFIFYFCSTAHSPEGSGKEAPHSPLPSGTFQHDGPRPQGKPKIQPRPARPPRPRRPKRFR